LEAIVSQVTFCHQNSVNSRHPASVKPAALNLFSRDTRSQTMKMIFAAIASTLLVSTAFAQTAAPAISSGQQSQPAGEANLKSGAVAQPDTTKTDASAKHVSTTPDKSEANAHAKKPAAVRTEKTQTHKIAKKPHSVVASVHKTTNKTDAGKTDSKEASAKPVKADGGKADTTQTN
jgi:predicted transglutaminase-like cysteine proteinase